MLWGKQAPDGAATLRARLGMLWAIIAMSSGFQREINMHLVKREDKQAIRRF